MKDDFGVNCIKEWKKAKKTMKPIEIREYYPKSEYNSLWYYVAVYGPIVGIVVILIFFK